MNAIEIAISIAFVSLEEMTAFGTRAIIQANLQHCYGTPNSWPCLTLWGLWGQRKVVRASRPLTWPRKEVRPREVNRARRVEGSSAPREAMGKEEPRLIPCSSWSRCTRGIGTENAIIFAFFALIVITF